jgi:ectoine hydroxylase-related dioxygenase (phytanoyl-CoA dioxygenase family)
MEAVQSELQELDERGFAVFRSFATPDEVARMTAVVDEVISSTLAEKEEQERERRAAGETGWVNVWHPGEEGVIFRYLTDQPDAAWILHHARLLDVAAAVKGTGSTLRTVGALAAMPGYGHQGFHPDREGLAPPVGSWDGAGFVFVLSTYRADTGTFRAIPGSHRTAPQFADWKGSAMPPHPDEVRIEAEPGDMLVYSPHLWKSATFNGGFEPCKSLLVG